RVADEEGTLTQAGLHVLLEPQVQHVVQEHVRQQGRAHPSHNLAKCPHWGFQKKGADLPGRRPGRRPYRPPRASPTHEGSLAAWTSQLLLTRSVPAGRTPATARSPAVARVPGPAHSPRLGPRSPTRPTGPGHCESGARTPSC